jgi:hypothetical protein
VQQANSNISEVGTTIIQNRAGQGRDSNSGNLIAGKVAKREIGSA